jgi:hypothetical protein
MSVVGGYRESAVVRQKATRLTPIATLMLTSLYRRQAHFPPQPIRNGVKFCAKTAVIHAYAPRLLAVSY